MLLVITGLNVLDYFNPNIKFIFGTWIYNNQLNSYQLQTMLWPSGTIILEEKHKFLDLSANTLALPIMTGFSILNNGAISDSDKAKNGPLKNYRTSKMINLWSPVTTPW